MLSKNEQKKIRLLSEKKYRSKYGLFIAEGLKIVKELIQEGHSFESIYSSKPIDFAPYKLIDKSTLNKVSQLTNASSIIGVFKIPKLSNRFNIESFSLALDSVSDPGNLGTIIRLCDWFGINDIFCSSDTVDCYNLKVVQSSMGSIARVKCHYIDLSAFLSKSELTVYGATLNGISHYENLYNKKGILVLGSESHGISPQVLKEIDQYVTINSKGVGTKADSLNVATATAILLGEVFRP
jgi:TrmH family RNA methyltransferase